MQTSKVHFMLVTILLEINCDYMCVNYRPNNSDGGFTVCIDFCIEIYYINVATVLKLHWQCTSLY